MSGGDTLCHSLPCRELSFPTSTPPDFKPHSELSLSRALCNNNHQMKVSDAIFPLLVHWQTEQGLFAPREKTHPAFMSLDFCAASN